MAMVNPINVPAYDIALAADAYRRVQDQKSRRPEDGIPRRRQQIQDGRLSAAVSRATTGAPSAGAVALPTGGAGTTAAAAASLTSGHAPAVARGSAAGDRAFAEAAFGRAQTHELKLRAEKQTGVRECETCSSRLYVDDSADGAVSFKAPGHISPEASMAVVSSHEREHVSNERARAAADDKKIVSQHVQLHMDRCPECGKSYVSGGTTTTTTQTLSAPAKSNITAIGDLRRRLLDQTYNAANRLTRNTPGQLLDIAA